MNTLTDPVTADVAAAPTAPAERAVLPDVLRGFALLGILLMNIEAFVGPLAASLSGLDPSLTGIDRFADAAIYVLVQGKFYTLFSLLFGAGFAMMLLRAEQRGAGGGMLYLRRTLVLLAIGLVHALLVWSGDILTVYGLMALVLLLFFRRTPSSRLPKWGLALYAWPMLLILMFGLAYEGSRTDPEAAAAFDAELSEQAAGMAAMIEAQREAYGQGSYADATRQRVVDLVWFTAMLPMFGPLFVGLFLIGAWLLRSGALLRPAEHLPLYRRLLAAGLLLGLPLALWSFRVMPTIDHGRMDLEIALANIASHAANLLLCLGYVAAIALLLQRPRWHARLALLVPAGRMALTNYLLQSLVCTAIFYHYGLGFFEQLPRAWQVPFVLVLYALQVVFSHWWLARFRFGPAEWLWRSLTYLKPQPMRAVAIGA
jgi:uncharacterized protein